MCGWPFSPKKVGSTSTLCLNKYSQIYRYVLVPFVKQNCLEFMIFWPAYLFSLGIQKKYSRFSGNGRTFLIMTLLHNKQCSQCEFNHELLVNADLIGSCSYYKICKMPNEVIQKFIIAYK